MARLTSPRKNQIEYLQGNQEILRYEDLTECMLEVALGIRPQITEETMCMTKDGKMYMFMEGQWCEVKLG